MMDNWDPWQRGFGIFFIVCLAISCAGVLWVCYIHCHRLFSNVPNAPNIPADVEMPAAGQPRGPLQAGVPSV